MPFCVELPSKLAADASESICNSKLLLVARLTR